MASLAPGPGPVTESELQKNGIEEVSQIIIMGCMVVVLERALAKDKQRNENCTHLGLGKYSMKW